MASFGRNDSLHRQKNEISEEEEYKVEVTIKKENLEKTMTVVKEIHPYEEPVINVIPLYAAGIGAAFL